MRILVCSDVHGNPYAMRSTIEKERHDVSIFLGDIVDYGPFPAECIDLVKDSFDLVVQGNHDYAASTGRDCMCSQENHDLSVYTRENITMRQVGSSGLEYLRSLPKSLRKDIDGQMVEINHGSPENRLYGYLYPTNITGENLQDESGSRINADILMVGHTHYQFSLPVNGMLIMNPGSIGQPRDGFDMPSYAVIDTVDWTVSLKRISYDRERLRRDIVNSMPEGPMRDKNLRLFRFP